MGTVASVLECAAASVEAGLRKWLPSAGSDPGARVREAMRYALEAGGKRLRPALVLESAVACGGSRETAGDAAFAVECLHTYSLAHDDLPAMDDDDLRRGKPSLHRAFDEGTAILAGDALLTLAFEILASGPDGAETCRVLARAAGSDGMVAGQAGDLAATGRSTDLDAVRWIHRHKTGALFGASAEIGAVVAGAGEHRRGALRCFGETLGLAFQIVDDVLDVTADAARLGKTPGKDARAGKGTYVAELGIDGARTEARSILRASTDALAAAGASSPALDALARLVFERTH